MTETRNRKHCEKIAGENMDNRQLTECFADVGTDYGFAEVSAKFVPFKDFKIRWTRATQWADFEVSDYLRDAPEEAVSGLAETLYIRIGGGSRGYPDVLCEYLTDPEFVRVNQPIYRKRFVGLSDSTVGKYRDLEESRKRLTDAGLLEDDSDIFIAWCRPVKGKKAGSASTLMKVAAVSSELDREDVNDVTLDYALYLQTANVTLGFRPEGKRRDIYDDLLTMFPRREEALTGLERLNIRP